jgi:Kef-type K+ transport system membrane component KefB
MPSAPAVLQNEAHLAATLAQLILIILAGRLLNRLFTRLGQPGAVGEIVAGLLLGPSLFGAIAPEWHAGFFRPETASTLFVLGQLGLILLMFEIGADFSYDTLGDRRHARATLLVALVSIAVPFACGVVLGLETHASMAPATDRTLYALFLGVALAITAVPILGRILREYGLNRHPVGVIAISAAALNDVVGWLVLSGISAFALARLEEGFLPFRLAALLGLMAAVRYLLPPVAARLAASARSSSPLPAGAVALVLALAFLMARATEAIGVFAIFGGFLAGLAFHRERTFVERWKQDVGGLVIVLLLPVFFTLTGLRTNIPALEASDLPLLLLVLAVANVAKILPVYAAARLAGLPKADSWLLGSLMNTRALMELIVLNIALDLGVLPESMFTILVLMAIVTTMMTGPLIRLLLPRMGLPAERQAGDF